VAISALLGSGGSAAAVAGAAVPMSVLGLTSSYIWFRVQARNAEYVRFRRLQLGSIEAQLEGMSTFGHIQTAFYEHKDVLLKGTGTHFSISARGTSSSTKTEGVFPQVMMLFWAAVFVGSAIATVVFAAD
jgi:hypothetical protein